MLGRAAQVLLPTVGRISARQLSVCVVQRAAATPTDPIQKLFVDKIREYRKKSQTAGGKLVDATPEVEKALSDELERVERQFNAKGVKMEEFPVFQFKDPSLEMPGTGLVTESPVIEIGSGMAEEGSDELKDFIQVP